MTTIDRTFDVLSLEALGALSGRRLLSTQSVHPWFANVWESSLRMDLGVDDTVISFEGIFDDEVLEGLADQLLTLRVRAGSDVPPWTLHGHRGRRRRQDDRRAEETNPPLIERVSIIRDQTSIVIEGSTEMTILQDLGVVITLLDAGEETDQAHRWSWDRMHGDQVLGIVFDQHEPVVALRSEGLSPQSRFGIHTYPGAVNRLLRPGERLEQSRFLVDL
jgi:hypothetical protein